MARRTAQHRSEASHARHERQYTRRGGYAAYAARKARRAERHAAREDARAAINPPAPMALEFDSFELDAICGMMPDWML